MSQEREYKLGYIKDRHDPRDFAIRRFIKPVALPTQFDLSSKMAPILDQGQQGSCVGNSCANLKDYQESKERGKQIRTARAFIYYEARKLRGWENDDKGAMIADAMKVLQQLGVPPESDCPYSDKVFTKPCEAPNILKDAAEYKIKSYARLDHVADIKQAIFQNGPVVIGIPVFENFFDAPHGVIPMPSGQLRGGHAVCVCGYDDTKSLLKFENSWGQAWGDWGFGYLPYEYMDKFLNDNEADAWTTVDEIVTPPPPPPPPGPGGLSKFRVAVNRGNSWVVVSDFQA